MQVTYQGGPLDGGAEELPDEQLPGGGVPYILAIPDQGPPVMRAGVEVAWDGRQHLCSWIDYRGLMRYEGSQALPDSPPNERHLSVDAVLV
jgi:hypothetical protein